MMAPTVGRVFPHQLRGVNKTLSHRHTLSPTWLSQSLTETLFSDSILSSRQLNITTRAIVSAVRSTDCFQRIEVQFLTPTYKSAPNSSVNTSDTPSVLWGHQACKWYTNMKLKHHIHKIKVKATNHHRQYASNSQSTASYFLPGIWPPNEESK